MRPPQLQCSDPWGPLAVSTLSEAGLEYQCATVPKDAMPVSATPTPFLSCFPLTFWLFLEPVLEKALLSKTQVSYQAPSCIPCLAWTTPYRMFSAPLDPDGTVFRLCFTAFVWWVITFPLFGFFFCIIWSLVFHFEYTVATDCGVSSRLPRTSGRGKVMRQW